MGQTEDEQFQELDDAIGQAIALCQERNDPLHFRNVYIALLVINALDPETLTDESLVYQYVQHVHERLGIPLYADRISDILSIEPGSPVTWTLRESIGYMFYERLPRTREVIRTARTNPIFERLDYCERGLVAQLNVDGQLYVVKTTLSDVETEIACHLGNVNLAPHVLESTPDEIVEEFILDPPLEHFSQYPLFIADQLGRIITELHQCGVIYNNTLLRHVFIREEVQLVRIIDLEGAYWGSDFDVDWDHAIADLARIYPDERLRTIAESRLMEWKHKSTELLNRAD
jgi:hypothetical protein